MASHEGSSFIWNGKKQNITPGQLLTGRDALARQTGIHRSSIERLLSILEIEHQIEQQKTTKFRIITIKKWGDYQESSSKTSNKRATNEQQMSTYKNEKNDKNEKNTPPRVGLLTKWEKDFLGWLDQHGVSNPSGYAKKLFQKYGKEFVLKCSRDSTCESLARLNSIIDFRLKK